MTTPKVMASAETEGRSVLAADAPWRLIGVAGVIFLLVGGVDAALVWYPLSFGSPEWEFGSVTASLNGLPLPVLGLVLMEAAALAQDQRKLARTLAVLLAIVAVIVLVQALLYITNVPIALRAVQQLDANTKQGLNKAVFKTATQLVCYPAGLGLVAWYSWRLTRSST